MSHASSVENKTHGIGPFVRPPALRREAALSAGGGPGNPEPLLGGALTQPQPGLGRAAEGLW